MSAADPFGLVGKILDGQFRVDQLVGEGGFSAVYRGHHLGLNEPIAIKCLKLPSPLGTTLVDSFVRRFRDESRILYRLSQGNLHIVRSMAAGTTEAPSSGAVVPYMVLEWLEGRSMQNDFAVRRTLGQTGRPLDEVVRLFDTAADGLAFAHAQGVAHRDLNPGNLFLVTTAYGVKMKVLDFGVAKLLYDGALDLGARAETVGSIKVFAPAYGAPEQFDEAIGKVGTAADVYSLALILMEALRDQSVNEGAHLGDFARAACDPDRRPTPKALGLSVSDEVEAVFARATALDPSRRWQTATDFWQELRRACKLGSERRLEAPTDDVPPPIAVPAPPSSERFGSGAPGRPLEPKGAAIVGKGSALNRTMPLAGSRIVPPRPNVPTPPHTQTKLGIPMPANAPRPMTAPASTMPFPPEPVNTPSSGVANAARGSRPSYPSDPSAVPSAAGGSAASTVPFPPASNLPLPITPREGVDVATPLQSIQTMEDDEDAEETRVHAPQPEFLKTLGLQNAAAARARAEARHAQEGAGRAPTPREIPRATTGGYEEEGDPTSLNATEVDEAPTSLNEGAYKAMLAMQAAASSSGAVPPPPPSSGGTLMMPPGAHLPSPQQAARGHGGQGGLGVPPPAESSGRFDSTLALLPHQVASAGFAPPQPMFGSTLQGGAVTPPAGAPIPTTHGSYVGSAPPPPGGVSGAPYAQGAYSHPGTHPSGPSHYGAGHSPSMVGAPGAPHIVAQSADFRPGMGAPGKKPFPVVPIAIGLGALALVGAGLMVVTLRSRQAPATADSTPSASVAVAQQNVAPPPTHAGTASVTLSPLTPPTVHVAEPGPVAPLVDASTSREPSVAADPGAAMGSNPAPATNGAQPGAANAQPVATGPSAASPAAGGAASSAAPAAQPRFVPSTPVAASPIAPAPTSAAGMTGATGATGIAAAASASAKSADPNAFSEATARARLAQANGVLAFCKKEGGMTGPGHASVMFANDGSVAGVVLDPPYAGTREGDCAAAQFRRAKISPFTGTPQIIRHAFDVPK